MAKTQAYEVVYTDGRKRVKLLIPEDAEQWSERKGIKSVKPRNRQTQTAKVPPKNQGASS